LRQRYGVPFTLPQKSADCDFHFPAAPKAADNKNKVHTIELVNRKSLFARTLLRAVKEYCVL
jgi:hypothetical protein